MPVKIMRFLILASLLTAFAVSCGGGSGSSSKRDIYEDIVRLTPNEAQCAETYAANKFIYDIMHTAYYWADQAALLGDIAVPIDVYSNILTASQYQSIVLRRNIGTGIAFAYSGSRLFAGAIAVNSPAAATALKKGYEIFSVNSVPASEIIANNSLNYALGANEEGVQVIIEYADYDGAAGSITIAKAEYAAGDIEHAKVFTDSATGRKTGYFLYHSFDALDNDLRNAVAFFNGENIDDLVIDLRRNTGGSLNTTLYLVNSFMGTRNLGEPILIQRYNDSYPDMMYLSQDLGYDFNLEKIVFIVSGNSASAGEALINALKPYKDVYVIGTTTYGKPVGSHTLQFCGNYLMPITFEVLNARREGGYFNGMTPDCYRIEDFTAMRDFGDPEEQQLKAAMAYLRTGTCESNASPFSAIMSIEQKPSYIELLERNTFR